MQVNKSGELGKWILLKGYARIRTYPAHRNSRRAKRHTFSLALLSGIPSPCTNINMCLNILEAKIIQQVLSFCTQHLRNNETPKESPPLMLLKFFFHALSLRPIIRIHLQLLEREAEERALELKSSQRHLLATKTNSRGRE